MKEKKKSGGCGSARVNFINARDHLHKVTLGRRRTATEMSAVRDAAGLEWNEKHSSDEEKQQFLIAQEQKRDKSEERTTRR